LLLRSLTLRCYPRRITFIEVELELTTSYQRGIIYAKYRSLKLERFYFEVVAKLTILLPFRTNSDYQCHQHSSKER
jgi:hypothetical protein